MKTLFIENYDTNIPASVHFEYINDQNARLGACYFIWKWNQLRTCSMLLGVINIKTHLSQKKIGWPYKYFHTLWYWLYGVSYNNLSCNICTVGKILLKSENFNM